MSATDAETRTVPEPDRSASGHSRHADIAYVTVGASARARCRPGAARHVERSVADRAWIPLSRPPSTRAPRMDYVGVEDLRYQKTRQVLQADGGWEKTTCQGGIQMESTGKDD